MSKFVHALHDADLVKKLLAHDLTATTAKILEACHNHNAIADNINAMGLTGSESVSKVSKQCPLGQYHKTPY